MMRRFICVAALLGCIGCRAGLSRTENRATGRATPQLVFLVSEDPDNYAAHQTIPLFADQLRKEHGFACSVLCGEGEPAAYRFPGLERVQTADLLVVFCRRVALPPDQLAWIQAHLKAGKPLIGIRTANHAFSVKGDVSAGYQKWWEFVPEVLGCENRGYDAEKFGTQVTIAPAAAHHPILEGIEPSTWHSAGSMYLVKPLVDSQAVVLLTGTAGEKTEPIAWTRMCGSSRVFYTSLGHPTDFEQPQFRRLLMNAIRWALARPG